MANSRAQEKHAELLAAKKAQRKERKRRSKSSQQRSNPDPSIHGEDVSKLHELQSDSSESEDIDTTPLGVMLAEPRAPKEDPDKDTRKAFESLPVLQLFKHHLKDFEGGSRKPQVAKDHTRRVCRLLYEIESQPSSVKPLWDSNNINYLKNNFFKGNDLLGKEEKRQPTTLKAYIGSLRLFFQFVIARQEEIRKLEDFGDADLRLVNSAMARLETWPKALADAMNKRKADIRLRDVDEKLQSEDYEAFFHSQRANEIKRMFLSIQNQDDPIVSVNEFAAMRDYLLMRVLLASGQRCGAASNLTIFEYQNGTTSGPEQVFVTRTLRHKTAKLFWDNEIKQYADTYLQKLRAKYATESSVAPATLGIPALPLFFISSKGNPLDESRASNRLAQMGKHVAPQMKGTLKSSRLRKSLVSLQRGDTSAAGSKAQLAKQMGHSVETAERYYNLQQEEGDANVHNLIERLTHGTGTVPLIDPRLPPLPQEVEGGEQVEGGLEQVGGEEVGGEEEGGGDEDSDIDSIDDISFLERNEIKRVFGHLLQPDQMILEPRVQAGKSRNDIIKDLKTSTIIRFLEIEKKKGVSPYVPSVQKEKSDLDLPAPMSSATDIRLFTPFETYLIMAVLNTLPPKASGKECLRAISNDKNCKEQNITQRYTQQQLVDKIKTIRRKAAREAPKF